jgi:selenocysteine lyase/cysteine desulfurase
VGNVSKSIVIYSTALDFWNTFGVERIQKHNRELAHKAARMLSEKWKTDTLFPVHMYGPMVLVRLPDVLWQSQMTDGGNIVNKANAEFVQDKLHFDYGIEVPIKPIDGRLYARISAHVYNEINHYNVLANAVCSLVEQCD